MSHILLKFYSDLSLMSVRSLQLSSSQRRLLVMARLLLSRREACLVLLDEVGGVSVAHRLLLASPSLAWSRTRPGAASPVDSCEVTPLHAMLKAQLSHAAMLVVTHRLERAK